MMRFKCFFSVLVLIGLVGVASSAELTQRPGPRLVIRDKGISEPVYLPPRVVAEKSVTATFEVTYNGFSAEAQAAFQAAVDLWSRYITSPVVIRVQADWTPLEEDVLGSAGSRSIWRGLASDPETWYPDALIDALAGFDVGEGEFDIVASFNSDYDRWYFGTDGNPPFNRSDLMSVVLHELCHGLGFVGSASVDSGLGSWGSSGFPTVFDRGTEDGSGNAVIDTVIYPNPSEALASVLESESVYWGGSNAVTVNGGQRPRLFAPSEWVPGSSYSHLDESTYPASDPNSLMTPFIGTGSAIHDPGPITLCLFEDLGWVTSETCTQSGSDCNTSYDNGISADAAWFGGGRAGDPNFMMGVHFRLSDFGYEAGEAEMTGFCVGNNLDLSSIGGPWTNRVFVYADVSGTPDDSVVLGQGDVSTGDGTGTLRVDFPSPVILNGDFWVINRGDPAHAGGDFNMEFDSASNVGRSFVSSTGLTGFSLTTSGNYVLGAAIRPVSTGGEISYWVAAAARKAGAEGSVWRTDLGAFNPSGALVNALIRYRKTGGGTVSRTVAIPARGQIVLDDVVGYLGSNGAGSLEVSSDQELLVGSRTYNSSVTGTYGQYLDGYRSSESFAAGDTAWLIMLEETAAFRTNIGFTNTGSTEALVQVKLFNSVGSQLADFSVAVSVGANVQENQPFLNYGGSSNVRAATASVDVISGSGVIIYGSVVDRETGDPTTIPGKATP